MTFFSSDKAEFIAIQHYGIKATARPLPGELDHNFLLLSTEGQKLILKIYHLGEDRETLEAQNQMLSHLKEHQSGLTFPEVVPNIAGKITGTTNDQDGKERLVRLLT